MFEETEILKYTLGFIGALGAALTALYMYIWRGDRARIKVLEDKMSQAVTMPQVETIVAKVEKEFKEDHIGLNARLTHVEDGLRKEIRETHDSLQLSINGIYTILTRPYSGKDRREE